MTSRLLAAPVILISSLALSPGQSPAPAAVPYDTYCAQESAEKRRTFQAATAEHKALLFRTQVERFRDANEGRLKPEHLSLLKEMLTLMVPATFLKGVPSPELVTKLESLETRMAAAFSREDLRAMDQFGPCIPKKIAK